MKQQIIIIFCLIFTIGLYAESIIKSGESIAFLGDSITQQGARTESGYVNEVISGLKVNGIDITAYPEGISGHKSDQMLARLENVITKNPTWLILSCGVNDVWHGSRGVELPEYTTNIISIVEQAQTAGVKVMLLTSTMIYEDEKNANNIKLDKYNEVLKKVAIDKNCILADLNKDMKSAINRAKAEGQELGRILTVDGVHMNTDGNMMMAKGVLKAFNFDDKMVENARNHWFEIPNSCQIKVTYPTVSITEEKQLTKLATEQNKTINQLLSENLNAYIQKLLTEGEMK